ncbi:hypothetical protein HID58_003664, partial [Brassica napus]
NDLRSCFTIGEEDKHLRNDEKDSWLASRVENKGRYQEDLQHMACRGCADVTRKRLRKRRTLVGIHEILGVYKREERVVCYVYHWIDQSCSRERESFNVSHMACRGCADVTRKRLRKRRTLVGIHEILGVYKREERVVCYVYHWIDQSCSRERESFNVS